jgi:hypothetical protein
LRSRWLAGQGAAPSDLPLPTSGHQRLRGGSGWSEPGRPTLAWEAFAASSPLSRETARAGTVCKAPGDVLRGGLGPPANARERRVDPCDVSRETATIYTYIMSFLWKYVSRKQSICTEWEHLSGSGFSWEQGEPAMFHVKRPDSFYRWSGGFHRAGHRRQNRAPDAASAGSGHINVLKSAGSDLIQGSLPAIAAIPDLCYSTPRS